MFALCHSPQRLLKVSRIFYELLKVSEALRKAFHSALKVLVCFLRKFRVTEVWADGAVCPDCRGVLSEHRDVYADARAIHRFGLSRLGHGSTRGAGFVWIAMVRHSYRIAKIDVCAVRYHQGGNSIWKTRSMVSGKTVLWRFYDRH